ncbi:MAG: thioredoxin-disulfide reductase [Chloroflexi bacterium HGW-Chloroflexi-2]|jgi:thioredoxin reductase (NADPH)|nr:MAG: thioredoxin-disulfide reductase [Chloroflexi bacterium HGW-Chloroflexi-2]
MELKLNKIATSENEANNVEKMIIIGAGPAGLSAALYAARAELSPVVITGMSLGGQASLTHTIENYPGFPDGVGGAELGELFQKQAERFGARFEFDNVTEVNFSESPYIVKTYGNEYKAETIVISTGASPNYLGVPGEKELTGKGVSYCGTCDGWFFKDKDIVVVGGGDSALEEGIFLTRFAKSVTIIHRRDQLRAGKILQTRAFNNPKIKFIWDSVVENINGTSAVESVLIKNVNTGVESTFPTDGVFVFIGHTPSTDLFKGQLAMDGNGYLQVDSKMQTAIPGVYAAGEVMDASFKQVVTSAGWGAAAAIQATKYLESKE